MQKEEIVFKLINSGIIKGDVDKTVNELEKLRIKKKLRAEEIVKFAENPKTELHKSFNWDDSVCARLYRISWARQVINACGYDLYETDSNGDRVAIIESQPLYENVMTEDGREYVNQVEVIKNRDMEGIKLLQDTITNYQLQALKKQKQYNDLINYYMDK